MYIQPLTQAPAPQYRFRMNNKATILIADDHALFLDGLKLILKKHRGIEIVAEAFSGKELLALLAQQPVDLIITDLSMPGIKGAELVKQIKGLYPATKLIVLTMHDEEEMVAEIIYAEAEGYILKNSGKAVVLKAVDDVLAGKTHYDENVMELFMKNIRKEKKITEKIRPLTEREMEVLQLIVQEFTSKEIAEKLYISKQTVDTHRINIMQKTGAGTLVGLIKYAVNAGLLNK